MVPINVNDNLTILLTLKNREEFTYRWLEYVKMRSFPFRIIIADGGSNDSIKKHIEKGNYKNLNILYKKYPEDINYETFYSKVKNALNLIQTPYYIVADNDDFYSLEGLIDAVKFLDSNEDYVACGGKLVPFILKGGKLYGNGIKIFSSRSVSYSEPKPYERIIKLLNGSPGIYYSVIRTKNGREVWEKICERNFTDFRMLELLIETYLLYSGKVHNLVSPFYFRQVGNDIGNTAGLGEDFFDEVFSKSWALEIDYIADQVVKGCNDKHYTREDFLNDLKIYLLPRFINQINLNSINSKSTKMLLQKGLKGLNGNSFIGILRSVIYARWGFFVSRKTFDFKCVNDFLTNKR